MGFSTVAKVVASVVIAGAGFAGGMKAAPVFGIGSGQDQGAEPVVTVDTTLVKNSFADIGELATESYNFTQVGKYSEEGTKVFGMEVPGTGAHYLITYSGEVKAGVADVSHLQGTARQGAGACGRHCEEAGQRCSWRAGQQVRGARRHCSCPR